VGGEQNKSVGVSCEQKSAELNEFRCAPEIHTKLYAALHRDLLIRNKQWALSENPLKIDQRIKLNVGQEFKDF
jgi:hypothetical protein